MRAVPAKRPQDLVYLFSVIAFILYAIRDGFTGSIRYLFTILHAESLWFIPDLMAFVSLGLFIFQQFQIKKNPFGIFFSCAFIFSTIMSVMFMNDTAFSLFSSMKMFIPMFVGFCFYERTITEQRWQRIFLLFIFLSSAVGLILSPYVDFPWVGQTITSFGMEREATKLWWQGGEIRYGGFAGDSTMAAYMTIFAYFLISPYFGFKINVMFWAIVMWAIQTSTSKTAIGTFYVYIAMYFVMIWLKDPQKIMMFLKFSARWSFVCLLIPPVAIIALSGVDLASISQSLFSIADRINNSWQLPFMHLTEIFPPGLFLGCGIGCFSYPMDYTSLSTFNVPVDNFYLTTFIMMGYPFLAFVGMQIFSIRFTKDPVRLILMTIFNIYCVTVQCYGPSFATLMFGYIFSEMFAFKPNPNARKFGQKFARRDGPQPLAN